jgi:type II secretory ATPase GspE/PulE/Tfp pilus assembly ATPase PilB-like protein
MSWFAKKQVATAPSHGLGLSTQPPRAETVALSTSAVQEVANLIKTLDEFPKRQEILSGVASSNPALKIPQSLENSIIAVKINDKEAVIAYDPEQTNAIKTYLPTMTGALRAQGLRVGEALLANPHVIKEVRVAGEALLNSKGGTHSTSGGANLFREWVKIAVDAGATDIHMQVVDGGNGLVTMRVDGDLEPVMQERKGLFTGHDVRNAMIAAFENMADLHSNNAGTFSDAKSMSCMIDERLGIPNIRLRFSSQRGFFGPKSVCRILFSEIGAKPMPFEKMGLAPSQIEMLERAQRIESGAIIQSGVTGSGKTTASKTLIETHPKNGTAAMYAVADPIEYLLKNVHQIYVQRDLLTLETAGQKDPYSEVIESLMRMDPDLVDVGEVRDQISARAMANVAKSGHVSLATLHTDSIGGIINRLTDPKLGLTRQELTSSKVLGFISYQALLPQLCQCAMPQAAIEDYLKATAQTKELAYVNSLVKTMAKKLKVDTEVLRYRNPMGCQLCRNRGNQGMTMVAEMMLPDDDWLDVASSGNDRKALREWRLRYSDRDFYSPDMNGKLVVEHTIYKALMGQVDPRNISRFGPLEQLEVLQ